jgi:hypothetical protein
MGLRGWFKQHPQNPEKYFPQHFDPREYYEFLIPQMLLRHFQGSGGLEPDLKEFYIGAG